MRATPATQGLKNYLHKKTPKPALYAEFRACQKIFLFFVTGFNPIRY